MPQYTLAIEDSQDAVARRLTDRLPRLLASLADRLTGGAVNRDNCRTPMQWDDSVHAGFSPPEADPWLPVAADGGNVNVSSQLEDPVSHNSAVKTLLMLRKERKELQLGKLALAESPKGVLGYYRSLGDRHLLILLNFSSRTRNVSPLSQGE